MLAIIGMAVSFTACSSDDDNDSTRDTRLIGVWKENESMAEISFRKNGTVSEIQLVGKSTYATIYEFNGEWTTVDDTNLTIHWKTSRKQPFGEGWGKLEKDEEIINTKYTISEDGKTLSYYDEDDGKYVTAVKR